MKTQSALAIYILAALLMLAGLACGQSQSLAQPALPATPAETAPAVLSTPGVTLPVVPTVAPSPTLLPSPSPTPDLPPPLQTPKNAIPALSPANAAALSLLEIWGLGSSQGLEWTADGSRVVLGYQAGILIFDAATGRQTLRLPTAGWLTGIDIAPDGQTLAVLHSDQRLDFYDLASAELRLSLPDSVPNRPLSLQYSPDGAALLLGLHDGMLASLALDGGQPAALSLFGDFGYPVHTLALSPSPARLFGAGDSQGLAVWQIDDPLAPSFLYHLPGTADVGEFLSLAVSPDGRWLAAGAGDGMLLLWDLSAADAPQSRMLWPQVDGFDMPGAWTALAFSADSRSLAAGGSNGDLWLWDVAGAASLLAAHAGQAALDRLAYSPDGATLAALFADGQAALFDSPSLALRHNLATGPAWIGSLAAMSGDGRFMATASQAYLGDGTLTGQIVDGAGLYLRRASDGSIIRQMDSSGFGTSPSGFTNLALSPDGRWLVASPLGLPLAVWDTDSGQMTYIVKDFDQFAYTCRQVRFSPDGLLLAGACYDRQISLWHTASGAPAGSLQAESAEDIARLDFSPDGAWLAGGVSSGPVYLWQLPHAAPARSFELFEPAPINWLSFSPDGRYLACSTGRDMPQVVIWDAASGEQMTSLGFTDRVSSAVFSPDARLLAVALDFEFHDRLEIWDWQAQDLLASLRYDSDLTQIFFSPDGRLLYTISQDGLLRVWGIARRE